MSINLEYVFKPEKLKAALLVSKNKRYQKKKKLSHLQIYYRRLDKFHNDRGVTQNQRLEDIKEMSEFIVKRRLSSNELVSMRNSFNRKKYSLLRLENCFVCNKKALERHHLVLLVLGGTNIPKNLVGLCGECHMIVHPWLLAKEYEREMDDRINYLIKGE